MELQDNDVRVYYKHKERIVEDWDLAIENCLLAFGMARWASGFDYTTEICDLAFRPMTEEEYKEVHG